MNINLIYDKKSKNILFFHYCDIIKERRYKKMTTKKKEKEIHSIEFIYDNTESINVLFSDISFMHITDIKTDICYSKDVQPVTIVRCVGSAEFNITREIETKDCPLIIVQFLDRDGELIDELYRGDGYIFITYTKDGEKYVQ